MIHCNIFPLPAPLPFQVADLGISRVLEAAGARDGYTMTGGVGTLRYMAPEAWVGGALNPKPLTNPHKP